jgi:hypothetical protein
MIRPGANQSPGFLLCSVLFSNPSHGLSEPGESVQDLYLKRRKYREYLPEASARKRSSLPFLPKASDVPPGFREDFPGTSDGLPKALEDHPETSDHRPEASENYPGTPAGSPNFLAAVTVSFGVNQNITLLKPASGIAPTFLANKLFTSFQIRA